MMKRFLLALFISLPVAGMGQVDDPVLMKINGTEVFRSEFEYAYKDYCSSRTGTNISVKDYAELFIYHKLKIHAAQSAGLDTVATFRNGMNSFRQNLSKAYLTDTHAIDSCVQVMYRKMKSNSPVRICIEQIFHPLPQILSARHIQEEEMRMDSLYREIKAHPEISFNSWVLKHSDEKGTRWIEPIQTTQEMQDILFSLREGEISKPFFTPEGVHIVRVIQRQFLPLFENIQNELAKELVRQQPEKIVTPSILERLKREHNFEIYTSGMEELKIKGETSQPLFSLDGHVYTGELFKRFAASHPLAMEQQLEQFITKSLLDYSNKYLEQKSPFFRYLLYKEREKLLLAEIMRREVILPGSTDRAGLATYFKFHKADYHWKQPRYKGIVLHCKNKKVVRQAKKIIKKLPVEKWAETIRQTFNTPTEENVKVETGIFAEGDNKYIDKLVYKEGDFEPLKSYPFTAALGKKRKGPDEYTEVREAVVEDYQNYLEADWSARLRESGKVEINQEVLKTVNNH